MNYQDTIDYLFQKLPIYQISGKSAYKEDIGNIIEACNILGNPNLNFKSIHVAGTNGKGSCSHMMSSILQEAEYKVGLYTSPHLKDFRERIKINGKMIPEENIINFVSVNKEEFEKINMSFFEMTVAMAFQYFSDEKVDIAIIECGLGGRLDSTNIINPEISVITNIGLDHTNLLGNTLERIAIEKAGIIKKETPVVIGRKQDEILKVFEEKVDKENSKIFYSENYNFSSDLKGNYQKENINTTVTTLKHLRNFTINEENIINGLSKVIKNTSFLGRWQTISKNPLVICDTAHNEDGLKKVLNQISEINYNKLHFVIGLVKEKNIYNILTLLPKDAIYYFCEANIPRAMDKFDLQKKSSEFNLNGEVYSSVEEALNQAKNTAEENDLIYVGGSTFVVAEII
ncbi:MAG: tetrahydrofolate synthase [Flavobacteriales bacterium]|nr:tetrahydrofolate synthase [Flavobacteriales bacterium]|tara:strand:+ start:1769 stop:2971 length:1203 start_codon:yes stop_codon:yes gene_type:complete